MKLKDKITQLREERNEERKEFKIEKRDLNSKLDKLLNLTQKERIDTNLVKIETEKYVKIIENLKVSEAKAKDQNKKTAKENAIYLKELHDFRKSHDEEVERVNILLEKISILESKQEEVLKKYNKSLTVIEKLETENIDMKSEIEMLRDFKQNNLQESKI